MPKTRGLLSVPLAIMLLTSACAHSPPEPVRPPRLEMPAAARQACHLERLPTFPTNEDVDNTLIARGVAIITCDGARELAVQTHDAEHDLVDQWLAMMAERRKTWWQKLLP